MGESRALKITHLGDVNIICNEEDEYIRNSDYDDD
jgi:hypothetical protein